MKTNIQPKNAFYEYQQRDIQIIFDEIECAAEKKLLYQLPTGGGKTVIFSEIAKRFMAQYGKKVVILTHRKELCTQTSSTLNRIEVKNQIISSASGNFKSGCDCYVAMVETLRNRIKSKKIRVNDVGLVIVDEAHHNSFRKLMSHFKKSVIIGVTATPFSSDVSKPMKRHYDTLITGENIADLIAGGFLARPKSNGYEVELNSLKTGLHGDYTVSSSNELYSSAAMQDLLLKAYVENSKGKKTLIFNHGIKASEKVYDTFTAAGFPIRHLDNKTSDEDRRDILKWFKKTKDAIITSVSILTTGFDEPAVQSVILNRATTSITLYHQMVGRGSRKLPSKRTFSIIDLGNNIQRFGAWEEPVDWKFVFEHPDAFAKQLQHHSTAGSSIQSHGLSAELRAQFPNTLEMTFDIETNYHEAVDTEKKPKTVIQQSIRQQAKMCMDNAETLSQAILLAEALQPEIDWRVKQYVKCLDNASKNYKEWLMEDYQNRLKGLIIKLYPKVKAA
ncbi:DEAD/DEAH box helicase [Flavobacterium reichenbachii]|uniref:DEAD/DEAH box helicase n=1 Tax=Flavobacterium reichenbachii TaxID=362418 RepID=A0A085ZI27_9FLAO|nr:DEAD/DEAH box helicase [Flavobacterium reichenbachii]KFF04091.1 DEAD/DEAH box helicase [Flavobacterium reichenbachii]OXB15866.1 DEAD/DEAH box helicase [Flavobacterium reichenbachii]